MVKNRLICVAIAVLSGSWIGCDIGDVAEKAFPEYAEPIAGQALAFTPIEATLIGYHQHSVPAEEEGGTPVLTDLDVLLNDYSPAGIQKRLTFLKGFRQDFTGTVIREELKGENWADYAPIVNYLDRVSYDFESAKVHENDPTFYTETLGMALYAPAALNYASETDRLADLTARLEATPKFLQDASANLRSSTAIAAEVAAEGVDGLISLIEEGIPGRLPTASSATYGAAAEAAVAALNGFKNHVDGLGGDSARDWRLGSAAYSEQFKMELTGDATVTDILAAAEAEFEEARKDTIEHGRNVHVKIYGRGNQPQDEAVLMKDVWDVVADDNRLQSGDQLIGQIREDLDQLRAFVTDKGLVGSPALDNLKIEETPEFLRPIVPTTRFLPAPSAQPEVDALYWVTPISSDWSRSRRRSKLREYNLFALKLLSLRQAIPGRYAQSQLANQAQPEWRRLLRTAFSNPAYTRGWVTYITEATVAAGFEDTSEEFIFNWHKYRLSVLADTIVDIKMHTADMSEEEATDFLRKQAFKEVEEARATIQRVALNPAELPSYYHGWKEWLRVRDHYQQEKMDYSPSSFHGKALAIGPLPLPELGYLLADRPMT